MEAVFLLVGLAGGIFLTLLFFTVCAVSETDE